MVVPKEGKRYACQIAMGINLFISFNNYDIVMGKGLKSIR